MAMHITLLLAFLASAAALPADQVVYKLDEDRYQYIADGEEIPRLVDLWVKGCDLRESARYNPDAQNIYYLFTRNNPSQSQVLVFGSAASVTGSNFDSSKRTAVIIHGWTNNATSPVNTVLAPAFLSAEDMNAIVVDWHAGAGTANYVAAVINTVASGQSVARFITWLNSVTGAPLTSYHIAGHSLGGHQAGIVGRNLGGQVSYITSLDPAHPGWTANSEKFQATDGIYTEVIHTNIGFAGYITPLGDVDFYPNGGLNMPGCDSQITCNHSRAYYYFGESLSSGGFPGQRCASYLAAIDGNCHSSDTLKMGGINPKSGETGVYHLDTNAAPPFSRG